MVQQPSLLIKLSQLIPDTTKPIVMLCIGTDRITGDCLGPLVGHLIREQHSHIPVYGTLEHPVHAKNVEGTLATIQQDYPDACIIAVDACLSQKEKPGTIVVQHGPLRPGDGIGRKLPPVGHISIIGVVNTLGTNKLEILKCTRLHTVMDMAEQISSSIGQLFCKEKSR